VAKVENELHVQAFNFYYGLGKSRSLKKVAEHFGKTERTIANWSRDFNWGERVTQRAIEEDESEQKRAAQTDVKSRYRIFCKELIDQAIDDFHKGKLKINNIVDLERVAKLDMALLDLSGEVGTSKVEFTPEAEKAISDFLDKFEDTFDALKVK
jgi:hypothetical protein